MINMCNSSYGRYAVMVHMGGVLMDDRCIALYTIIHTYRIGMIYIHHCFTTFYAIILI